MCTSNFGPDLNLFYTHAFPQKIYFRPVQSKSVFLPLCNCFSGGPRAQGNEYHIKPRNPSTHEQNPIKGLYHPQVTKIPEYTLPSPIPSSHLTRRPKSIHLTQCHPLADGLINIHRLTLSKFVSEG